MSVPQVTLTQLDGALGVIPPGLGDTAVVIAPADSGPLNTPAAFSDGRYLVSNYGAGPLVELGSYLIAKGGKPVIVVRSDVTTDGTTGVIDVTGVTGTSVPSFDGAAEANDEYEPYVIIVTGGTIGVDGITYKYSLDGGRTLSAETALGTADTLTIPDSGGVAIDFAAGTLVAGDVITSRSTPPTENTSDLQTSFAAMQASQYAWDFVVLGNVVDATKFAALDTWMSTLWTKGKHKKFLCSPRGPNVGESEADYLTAMSAAFGSSSSLFGGLCYGYAKTLSAVSAYQLRRPTAWVAAARAAKLLRPSRDDMSAPMLGPLPSDIRISDAAGNPDEHNEELNPGADDARFLTLRSLEGYTGTYITRPRIFAPTGSDFVWWQYRSVINKVADAVKRELTRRLRAPVRVSRKTGFILEQDALDIESGVNAAVEAEVGAGPDVSGHKFVLSRTDPLLSNPTLNGAERVIPLAYPDQIGVTLGFVNPARVQPV